MEFGAAVLYREFFYKFVICLVLERQSWPQIRRMGDGFVVEF